MEEEVRRRRGRRGPNDDEDTEEEEEVDDYDDDEEGLAWWKTVVVLGVTGACFLVAYPMMFHPMILFALGLNSKTPPEAKEPSSPHSPMKGRDPRMGSGRIGGSAAAATTGGGFGKAAFATWTLPLFAFGVIAFLLYSLGQGKSDRKKAERKKASRNTTLKGSSGGRIGGLEKRLVGTEEAMSKILGQLESLSARVPSDVPPSDPEHDSALKSSLAKVAEALQHDAPTNTQRSRKGKVNDSDYLRTLEVALNEFSVFTEDYIQAKLNKGESEENVAVDANDSEDSEIYHESVDESDFVHDLIQNEAYIHNK